jgi:hypothetical protein
MSLLSLPRPDRFIAIKAVMDLARENGISGMSGECGELAVAMKRILFGGEAILVAGLNAEFEKHNHLIGHFAVRIDDEEWGCANFDERGIPVPDDEIEAWGMLDPTDTDYLEAADELGFTYTPEVAETATMLEFDEDQDVLINMRGSGLDSKLQILLSAMTELGHPVRSLFPSPKS